MKRLVLSCIGMLTLAASSAFAQAKPNPTGTGKPDQQQNQPGQKVQGQVQPGQGQTGTGQAVQGQAGQGQTGQAQGTAIRGKIVRTQGTDQVIIQTPEKKEITLYAGPKSRYMINNKSGQFNDLRVGAEINANYQMQGDRYMVDTFNLGGDATTIQGGGGVAPAEGTMVEGTVVRVIDNDQVVVKTGEGKEVIVYVQPQTQYTGQQTRFTDLRPGAEIRVNYDVRENRNMARNILDRVRGK